MHPDCVLEVAAAIGRTPTAREIEEIEGNILRAMREIARTEPRWRQMTGDQRLQAAAAMAHEQALQAAEVSAQRRASNLLAQSREAARLQARAQAKGGKSPFHEALFERLRQADDYVSGVRNEAMSGLVDAIEAVEPRFFGLMDDPKSIAAFARAVMEPGGNHSPEMVKAAKAYTDTLEDMRVRANAAGADIGKLDYGYLPQPHDVGRIARAGKEKWVEDIMGKLARDRYTKADGSVMDDAELADMLGGVYDTLSTEGRNKMIPGQSRGGSRASRFDEAHRVIHFADADSYLAYLGEYGRGSMMQSIHGHVGMMAKTIGLMEEFGANPNSTYRLLKDLAEQGDNASGRLIRLTSADMLWDTLNGVTGQPVSANLAAIGQGIRNFTTATKLQGVMLSALTDAPLQVLVARSAGIPMGDALKSLFVGWGKNKREIAHDLALGMDEISGEMARWHQDHLAQGWTAKLANTTMRLTLVEGWTNALRRGFALTLSGTLDRLRATDWDALKQGDRNRFESAGVTADDWRIWQQAQPTQVGNSSLLTKDGIRGVQGISEADKNRATARLLGYLDQEARMAVFAPDIQTRALIQQGTRPGTFGGEVLRSVMLFKSFPVGMLVQHLRRLQELPNNGSRVAYSVAMMTALPLFGAVSMQLKDLVQGKDPRDATTGKFWGAAFAQGGGLGILGDVLYTGFGGESRNGQPNWQNLLGPIVGTGVDLANATVGNLGRYAAAGTSSKRDKVADKAAADALRLVRGNTPFINLWYARAAIDHLVMHDLQEQVSPGYLRKMKKRVRKDWEQEYWWDPEDSLPNRAPNLEKAIGEK